MTAISHFIHRSFALPSYFVNAVTPPVCLACHTPIAQAGYLCPECWKEIQFISPPFCDRLGTPFPYDPGYDFISPRALENPPSFTRARASFLYEGLGRQLIHNYKYKRQLFIAPILAKMMMVAGANLLEESDVILPVPLHWSRVLKRGFNQSARLCLEIATQSEKPLLLRALRRKNRTQTQVGLAAREREKNVSRAFTIEPKYYENIVGKRILLIDDVLTSGATANACAKTLLKAGALDVNLLVAALVMEK